MSGTTDLISMTRSDPVVGMEREDVDRAALAADVERDLGRDQPIRGGEEFEGPLDEVGVTGIE